METEKVSRAGLEDGAFKSRKFLLTILAVILITAVAVLSIWFSTIISIMPTFIGGVLGVLSLYFTGNVMSKHVTGNNIVKLETVKRDIQIEE